MPPSGDGPAAKKRKLQNGNNGQTLPAPIDVKDNSLSIQFYVRDVSFATPQRKKLTLEITAGDRSLRARNQTTKEVEFGVPMDQIRESFCQLSSCTLNGEVNGLRSLGNQVMLSSFQFLRKHKNSLISVLSRSTQMELHLRLRGSRPLKLLFSLSRMVRLRQHSTGLGSRSAIARMRPQKG